MPSNRATFPSLWSELIGKQRWWYELIHLLFARLLHLCCLNSKCYSILSKQPEVIINLFRIVSTPKPIKNVYFATMATRLKFDQAAITEVQAVFHNFGKFDVSFRDVLHFVSMSSNENIRLLTSVVEYLTDEVVSLESPTNIIEKLLEHSIFASKIRVKLLKFFVCATSLLSSLLLELNIKNDINIHSIRKYAAEKITIQQFLRDLKKESNYQDKIRLVTAHSSKGSEAEIVFVLYTISGTYPHNKSDTVSDTRLFYVASTRAKCNVTLTL